MKRAILYLTAMILTLLITAIFGAILDYILGHFAALFDYDMRQADFTIDKFAIEANLALLVIPYLLYIIIFKIIIIKREVSLRIKEIVTASITCSLFVVLINTLVMVRPDMLKLYVIVPLIISFIIGFSLPFVDEFFMKKFGLKD